MDDTTQMYYEEVTPSNEIKGFTKSFQKRSKDKKEEDQNIVELLSYNREGKLVLGSKVTEKAFKLGNVAKVYAASNCDELTLDKARHYGKLAKVEVITLDIDSNEFGQRLTKPFNVKIAHVRSQ